MASGLVRDVIERRNPAARSAPVNLLQGGPGGSLKTGFPAVHHRSKASAFKRARHDERVQSGLSESRELSTSIPDPTTVTNESREAGSSSSKPAEDWMSEISRSNEEVVAKMDEDERERERQDIIDKFGSGIEGLMSKVREARERRAARQVAPDAQDVSREHQIYPSSDTSPLSPPIRSARKIRFAEPTEADVHVYESQPSSPKRPLALLPPPKDARERGDIQSLGSFKSTSKSLSIPTPVDLSQSLPSIDVPEEGTPEDIRRRFFPSEMPPEVNPALAWMLPSSVSSPSTTVPSSDAHQEATDISSIKEPRYSLSGTRLSPAQIRGLPTHLGLHHHATSSSSDTLAGYALSDLLLLSRSSVPAQRATMLAVLAKLLRNTRENNTPLHRAELDSSQSVTEEDSQPNAEPLHDIDLDGMRRDLVDAAIDALDQKGGVGQHAVELLWEAVVGFIHSDYGVIDLKDLTNVDLTRKTFSPPSSSSSILTISPNSATKTPNSSHAISDITMSLPVVTILPILRQHLIASPSALSRTHTQVLEILLVLSHFAVHAETIVNFNAGHGIVATMLEPHLRSSFGSDSSEGTYATPTSILVLQALARSSRHNAVKLTGPADVLLRYVTEPRSPPATWSQSAECSPLRISTALLEETLRFYGVLSQYGLYSQIASIAQEAFASIGAWILDAMRITIDPALVSLLRAYVNLLGNLIVCATDPHQTTPSHDILWSQVQGWGWLEWIMEAAELVADAAGSTNSLLHSLPDSTVRGLWADLFNMAAAFMEGATVNGIKSGATERSTITARLGPLLQTGSGNLARSVEILRGWVPSSLNTTGFHDLAPTLGLAAATTRLAISCFTPGATGQPFPFFQEDIQAFCIQFTSSVSFRTSSAFSPGHDELVPPETAYASIRHLSALLFYQLKFWRRSILDHGPQGTPTQNEEWTTQALRVLRTLIPGDEDYAQWITESICETVDSDFVHRILPTAEPPREVWGKGGMNVLLPFLSHSLRPVQPTDREGNVLSQATYVAPLSPSPKSISRCTTLMIPSASRLREAWDSDDPDTALPLSNDWPMLPLNHLLRSGTSSVFRELPSNWDASETDVVRASLLLARVVQKLWSAKDSARDRPLYMSSAEATFACMKVFMLEHGQQQLDSGEEVFRDTIVTRWMEELLKPFTYSYSLSTLPRQKMDNPRRTIEAVSHAFLGAGTPFYQFYTDFLALYDAISFSHPLFARLLLPPVSMSYPIDYRKLLFGDFAHVLRTVRTAVPDLLCSDVREYLWPVEHDAHVIGWFLKSLLTSQVHGAVRWIVLHHVAANIWPDFTNHPTSRERAGKLLSAILQQGNNETVREVALYRQQEDEVWAPPRCFEAGELSWRSARLEWVKDVTDERAKIILQNLLLE